MSAGITSIFCFAVALSAVGPQASWLLAAPFFEMEQYDGSLEAVLRAKHGQKIRVLGAGEVVVVAAQLADAVMALHAANVIHR